MRRLILCGCLQVAGAWAQLVASTSSSCDLDATAAKALAASLCVIEENNLSEHAVTWFLDTASAALASRIAPKFWAFFEGFEDVKGSKVAPAWASLQVSTALAYLSQALDAQLQVARAIESSSAESGKHYGVVEKCRANLAAVVFRPVHLYFHEILYLFLSKEFANFARRTAAEVCQSDDDEQDDDDSDDRKSGDSMKLEDNEGAEVGANKFRQVCSSINHVGALSIAEEVLTEVLYDKIAQRIKKRCAERWDARVLNKEVECWARRSVWPLLRQLRSSVSASTQDSSQDETMGGEEGNDEEQEQEEAGQGWDGFRGKASVEGSGRSKVGLWRARLELFMYETFTNLRISELFDMMVDFPDSVPALLDLKESLAKTHQYPHLVTELRAALHKRLLHAGANTSGLLSSHLFLLLRVCVCVCLCVCVCKCECECVCV